jgi:hypothetical protein
MCGCWVGWHTPIISALGSLTQKDFEFKASLSYREFQASLGYIAKPGLTKQKQKVWLIKNLI